MPLLRIEILSNDVTDRDHKLPCVLFISTGRRSVSKVTPKKKEKMIQRFLTTTTNEVRQVKNRDSAVGGGGLSTVDGDFFFYR